MSLVTDHYLRPFVILEQLPGLAPRELANLMNSDKVRSRPDPSREGYRLACAEDAASYMMQRASPSAEWVTMTQVLELANKLGVEVHPGRIYAWGAKGCFVLGRKVRTKPTGRGRWILYHARDVRKALLVMKQPRCRIDQQTWDTPEGKAVALQAIDAGSYGISLCTVKNLIKDGKLKAKRVLLEAVNPRTKEIELSGRRLGVLIDELKTVAESWRRQRQQYVLNDPGERKKEYANRAEVKKDYGWGRVFLHTYTDSDYYPKERRSDRTGKPHPFLGRCIRAIWYEKGRNLRNGIVRELVWLREDLDAIKEKGKPPAGTLSIDVMARKVGVKHHVVWHLVERKKLAAEKKLIVNSYGELDYAWFIPETEESKIRLFLAKKQQLGKRVFWIQLGGRLVDFYPQYEAVRIAGCHPAELLNWRMLEDGGKGQICRPLRRCIQARKHPLDDAVFGSKWGNILIIYNGDDLRVIEKEKKRLRQVRPAPRPPINSYALVSSPGKRGRRFIQPLVALDRRAVLDRGRRALAAGIPLKKFCEDERITIGEYRRWQAWDLTRRRIDVAK